MLNLKKVLKKQSLTYALTGLSPRKFRILSKKFDSIIASKKSGDTDAEKQLETAAERLFFVLFYYTVHPTQNLMRTLFGYGGRNIKSKIEEMTPAAEAALHKKLNLPKHRVKTLKDFYSEFSVPRNVFTLGIPAEERHKINAKDSVTEPPVQSAEPAEPQKNILRSEAVQPGKASPVPERIDSVTAPEVSKSEELPNFHEQVLAEREAEKTAEKKRAEEEKKAEEQAARIQELIEKEVASRVESLKNSISEHPTAPLPPSPSFAPPPPAPTPQRQPIDSPPSVASTGSQEQRSAPARDLESGNLYKKGPEPQKEEAPPEWVAKLESKMTRANPDEIIGHRQEEAEPPHLEIKELEKNTSQKLSGIKDIINKQLKKPSDELSIIELVDAIIQEGFYSRASDIHIEPEDKNAVVRLRIDGMLHDVVIYPKIIHSAVITRIKVLAGLRTDEHQAAQDGRFKTSIPDAGFIDIRVSIAPTYYGENCVMRVLTQQKELSLEEIGLTGNELKKVMSAIERPYGMILTCGPTGSGKTSSLYAILRLLNTRDVSIITIEDPIEYSMKGLDQIQVNAKTGLTFANGLRALLRQDPDIMMVGEIRDEETAKIAVNAALTGHLLLSTLHTNDAATALPRLVDMDVEPFLVSSTVNIVIGQRLIRRICTNCKEAYVLNPNNLRELSVVVNTDILEGNTHFYRGKGCAMCDGTGYKGRVGIFEVLEMMENIKSLVMSRASSDDIKYVAIKNGMVTMLEDGMKKAAAGETTIEEVLRVARE